MCHHGHQVHLDDRRHHRGDRRNRHHHRGDRRNRRHHRGHRGHRDRRNRRDDRERHHEPDAHRGDWSLRGRASCPGSDADRPDGDRRRRRQPDGRPAAGAFPGWEQRGCCPDGQPEGRRDPHGARGFRGHLEACPGSGRTGCCRGEGRRGEGRGEGRRHHPRVPLAPRVSQVRAHRRRDAPEPRVGSRQPLRESGPKERRVSQRRRRQEPPQEQRARLCRAWLPTSWLPTSWGQLWPRSPWRP